MAPTITTNLRLENYTTKKNVLLKKNVFMTTNQKVSPDRGATSEVALPDPARLPHHFSSTIEVFF